MRTRRKGRAQSAMEYLMTYGWAILIIAVVLGSLYSLGVFNTANLQPKVAGGGCHVYRPNGPGTTWNINLVGSCQNALPQYVAQFNGQSSYVDVGSGSVLSPTSAITFTAWIDRTDDRAAEYVGGTGLSTQYGWGLFVQGIGNEKIGLHVTAGTNIFSHSQSGGLPAVGVWTFVAGTYDGSNAITYVNGVAGTPTALTGQINYNGYTDMTIGMMAGEPTTQNFNGSIANVQIYNTSLTANQVTYLYHEGIGGVPVSLQNLVGWWPLNGDTKDYSGSNNNGAPTAVNLNGTWSSGYYH